MRTWIMNLPIKKKFMLSYGIIIVVISLSVGVISTLLTTSRLQKETLNMASQLAQQVSENIRYRADEMETLAYQLISDNAIRAMLGRNLTARSTALRTNDAVSLAKDISQYLMRYSSIESVLFYMANGQTMDWEKGNPKISITADPQANENRKAMQKAENAAGDIAWMRAGTDTVLLAKKAIDIDTLDTLGFIVIRVNADFFHLEYDQGESLIQPANMIVLDKAESIVLGSGFEDMDDTAAAAFLQKASGQNEIVRYHGDAYLLTTYAGNWNTLCFIPMKGIRASVTAFWLWSLSVCVVLGALALLIARYFSNSMTYRIEALSTSMRKVETGDFSISMRVESQDEVGLLTEQFNHMVHKIDGLVQSVSEEQLKRQAMEYQVLQAQINPHFLYNTLGSVRCLAQLHAQYDIETMLSALINLLKATLSTQGSVCTLQTELTCVESYLVLQKVRYANGFQASFEIADGTETCQVLSFILQPLVENALLHGLVMESERNEIVVSAQLEGQTLVLEVRDNGVGMTQETITRILSGTEERRRNVTSIGLSNIHERIRYYYGEKYGVSIQSAPGQGSVIRLTLPRITEVSAHD